jgi:hypothetical protein
MRSRPVDTALRDILHHIDLAAGFSAGFDADAFKRDLPFAKPIAVART